MVVGEKDDTRFKRPVTQSETEVARESSIKRSRVGPKREPEGATVGGVLADIDQSSVSPVGWPDHGHFSGVYCSDPASIIRVLTGGQRSTWHT